MSFHPLPDAPARRLSIRLLFLLVACTQGCGEPEAEEEESPAPPVAVEVARVSRGTMVDRRELTGTLEPYSVVTVASKVAGRVDQVAVDVGDAAPEGALLVSMDDAELRQAVAMARADLTVAQAQVMAQEAEGPTAQRELARIETLHKKALVADSALDAARTTEKAAAAALQMAEGQLQRARVALTTARTQLSYARLRAPALPAGRTRVVSERLVDPGVTVTANTPLLTLMEIDPLVAVVAVTEHEYARVTVGQKGELVSDALPGERFEAVVERVSPAFDEGSRKARVHLRVDNAEQRLKPGIFVRARLTLSRSEDVAIVPELALTRRDAQQGVFLLDDDGQRVKFVTVQVGVRSEGRVSVSGSDLRGQVVTVGQERLEDGDRVTVQESDPPEAAPPASPASDEDDG